MSGDDKFDAAIQGWGARLRRVVEEDFVGVVSDFDVEVDLRAVKERPRDQLPGYQPRDEMFHISLATEYVGDYTVVRINGELDVCTGPQLRALCSRLVREGRYLQVLDLEGVDFLDSTSLGIFTGLLKRIRAHDGHLRLVCTQERILKIFRVTGLTKVFPFHRSVEEAIEADIAERAGSSNEE